MYKYTTNYNSQRYGYKDETKRVNQTDDEHIHLSTYSGSFVNNPRHVISKFYCVSIVFQFKFCVCIYLICLRRILNSEYTPQLKLFVDFK